PVPAATGRDTWLLDVVRVLIVAGGYFLTARISMQFSGMPAHISFIWLPAGLALAVLLLGGLRLAAGIAIGAGAAQYSVGGDLWVCIAFALGSTSSAILGGWLLQRKHAFSGALENPRDVLSLIAVGAFLSPVIAASFGTGAAYLGRLTSGSDVGS